LTWPEAGALYVAVWEVLWGQAVEQVARRHI